jgi:hypothetical protein
MGYYTYYELGVHHKRDKYAVNSVDCYGVDTTIIKEMARKLDSIMHGEHSYIDAEPNNFEDVLYESMKWYDHDNDMRELSKLYPDYYFTLRGSGEEWGDWWQKLFRDGELLGAVEGDVIYPDFDVSYGVVE